MARVSDQVVIIGAGETTVGKLPGLQSVQIQAWAVQQALADCGLRTSDVDGLINLDPYAIPESMFSSTLMEYLGLKPKFLSTVDVGGTVSGWRCCSKRSGPSRPVIAKWPPVCTEKIP